MASGIVLFAYVFTHFANHALGNISYHAMEGALNYHFMLWRHPPGTALLFIAAIVHFSLGLWALYQRPQLRMTRSEITQLILGLSIPYLLVSHFVGLRRQATVFDRDIFYGQAFYSYWIARPYHHWVLYALLLVTWTHGCIGLYFWLRLKHFYNWAAPFLLAGAVLLPALALLGLVQGARQVVELSSQPQWRAENLNLATPEQRELLDSIVFYFLIGYTGIIGLVFVARGIRTLNERRRGMFTVSYPDRQVRVPMGMSVLEASQRFNVPHACVCGGRARCSTCRVRVISDRAALPLPSGRETLVLARFGAGANPAIRLACQLRPDADIAVIPILPPHVGADFVRDRHRVNIGQERYVVSMFVDMRGSTALAEARMPFDIVFLVNQFLGAASKAVIDAGGQPNQFLGDGLLALFGLNIDRATACRQAMRAAALVAINVAEMNRQFAADLREPIAFGIGIHGGDTITGDIGFRDHTVFTAMGDAVNVAARLQDMTKSLNCQVIVSEEVCRTAGVTPDAAFRTEVTLRGRNEPMAAYAAPDPAMFSGLLDR